MVASSPGPDLDDVSVAKYTATGFREIMEMEIAAQHLKIGSQHRKMKWDTIFNVILPAIAISITSTTAAALGVTAIIASMVYLLDVERKRVAKKENKLSKAGTELDNAFRYEPGPNGEKAPYQLNPDWEHEQEIVSSTKELIELFKEENKIVCKENKVSGVLAVVGSIVTGSFINTIYKTDNNEHHTRIAMEWATGLLVRTGATLGLSIWRTNNTKDAVKDMEGALFNVMNEGFKQDNTRPRP